MSGFLAASFGAQHLDTQTVTTGATGTGPNRFRGYSNGSYGSISSGTSAIYGATISDLYWTENGGSAQYVLQIASSPPNSGWATMTIGTTVLSRAAATFTAGSFWTWNTSDTVASQAFGAAASVHSVYFD